MYISNAMLPVLQFTLFSLTLSISLVLELHFISVSFFFCLFAIFFFILFLFSPRHLLLLDLFSSSRAFFCTHSYFPTVVVVAFVDNVPFSSFILANRSKPVYSYLQISVTEPKSEWERICARGKKNSIRAQIQTPGSASFIENMS